MGWKDSKVGLDLGVYYPPNFSEEDRYGPNLNDEHVRHRITDRNHNFCILKLTEQIEYQLSQSADHRPISLPTTIHTIHVQNILGRVYGFGFHDGEPLENLKKAVNSNEMYQRKLHKISFRIADCQEKLPSRIMLDAIDPPRIQRTDHGKNTGLSGEPDIWLQK